MILSQSQQLRLTVTQTSYINLVLSSAQIFNKVYLSQETMGAKLGICRQQVNTISSQVRDFVIKSFRGFKKTCLYTINPLMYRPEFIKQNAHIFPSLVWCSLGLLSHSFQSNTTQANNKEYISSILHAFANDKEQNSGKFVWCPAYFIPVWFRDDTRTSNYELLRQKRCFDAAINAAFEGVKCPITARFNSEPAPTGRWNFEGLEGF